MLPRSAGQSAISAWLYANWRGAYDLKALAQSVDLICLMTYDQHTRWTAPGPVAGRPVDVERATEPQMAPTEINSAANFTCHQRGVLRG